MEYLRNSLREIMCKIMKVPKQESVSLEVSRSDAYFDAIHKILVWEDPTLSWLTLGVFHVLFWIIVQFQLRLYGIAFLIILLAFVVDLYFERTGLQAPRTRSSDAVREALDILFNTFLYLKVLRKDNPPMFCGVMCTIFLTMSMLSKNVPGYFLTYMLLLTVFFGPLALSKLPSQYKNTVGDVFKSLSSNDGILAETELMPFISNKNMNERDPELESLLTDKTGDSITSSLISGINSMPSYLEAEGSIEGLDEDDLIPNLKSNSVNTLDNSSSDSDSDHKNIKFDSAHFRDSSSDDEKHYTAGLRFSELSEVTDSPVRRPVQDRLTQSLTIGLLSNLTAVGTSILSNVMSGATAEKPKRKDSDSDFEFINANEADE